MSLVAGSSTRCPWTRERTHSAASSVRRPAPTRGWPATRRRSPRRTSRARRRRAYVFSARLPAGVSKEEVRVDVEEGHVLVIAGERSVRREARSDEARHVIERSCASFFGRFCLPDDAAVRQVRAAMDDGGELVVTVPRIGAAVVALPDPALAIEVEASPC
ncbi:hypothetical protein ACQ4PT_071966 [Festuca glaucescens]